jgi:hypothetical protein
MTEPGANDTVAAAGPAKAGLKAYAVPFVIGFVVSILLFLGLDYLIMSLQGLSLIFEQ